MATTNAPVPTSDNVCPADGSDGADLDSVASRLYQSAEHASAAAENAYAAGVETAPTKVKQVAGKIKDTANMAADSSRAFLSKVVNNVDKYTVLAQEKAANFQSLSYSPFKGKTGTSSNQTTATTREASVESDSDAESVGFPLSILTWCGTLCGSSKKGEGNTQLSRELPTSYLKGAADRLSSALTDAATKLEEATGNVQQRATGATQGATNGSRIDAAATSDPATSS